ncbi:hypothetical protein TNCV_2753391 [Trichonephila clavipes]|nr:hypothetical protein TNCV_2753391 [Trichonephila clavipes]
MHSRTSKRNSSSEISTRGWPFACVTCEAVLRKKGNASAVLHEFRRRKNLRRGQMSNLVTRVMIKRFEETGKLGVQSGRGRKRGTPVFVEAIKTVVDVQSQTSEFEGSSARAVFQ